VKFSIFMMPLHYPTENASLVFDRDISLIEYADELGYDEFFIGEHRSGLSDRLRSHKRQLPKLEHSRKDIQGGRCSAERLVEGPDCAPGEERRSEKMSVHPPYAMPI
jgi:hypothetical protein